MSKAKTFSLENKENDPAELGEIGLCNKNVVGKNENLLTY